MVELAPSWWEARTLTRRLNCDSFVVAVQWQLVLRVSEKQAVDSDVSCYLQNVWLRRQSR